MLYTLVGPASILLLTAIAVVTKAGTDGLTTNSGAHGFTEIFYAYASSNANNGQNFAGLSANSPFYNITTAIAMFVGRFMLAIPALALAGLLARQRRRPVTGGTLPTETLLFASVVAGSALLVSGLSYLPALALGPIVEHLQMLGGHLQ
jgi:K+-transporting ATPase ATPase A chain